jgi:hypothetical protein
MKWHGGLVMEKQSVIDWDVATKEKIITGNQNLESEYRM